MRKIIFAAMLTLAACGTSPKVLSSNPAGVSYTFDGSDSELKTVTAKAATECQKSGHISVLKNVSKTDDSSVAHFDCVGASE